MSSSSPLRNRIKELRERLGLRQSDLASEVGVTRQSIIAIEKGRFNPSILLGLKMARILREPVDYVFYLAHDHRELEVTGMAAAPAEAGASCEAAVQAAPEAPDEIGPDWTEDEAESGGKGEATEDTLEPAAPTPPPSVEDPKTGQSIWDFV